MYGVVGMFTMDRTRDEEHRRAVGERLIPFVRQVPGFVSGFWTSDPAGPKNYVLTIWDTEEHARAFAQGVERDRSMGEQAGVGYDSLTVVEVIGEAHR